MSFADNVIENAIAEGHSFLVLEPREIFAPSLMEFHKDKKRLVYKVDILLSCLSKAYKWGPIEALEWFDFNIFDLTYMSGGPIFYDESEEKYLTIDD